MLARFAAATVAFVARPRVRAAIAAALVGTVAMPAVAGTQDIEMISTGTGAKRQLRLKPAPNSTQQTQLTWSQTMSMDMGGFSIPETPTPPLVVKMKATVDKVEANGDIHYSFELTEANVGEAAGSPPEAKVQMEAQARCMVGVTGQTVLTHTGVAKSGSVKAPSTPGCGMAGEAVEQNVSGMGAALPTQPVGVGAKWKVTQTNTEQGFTATQVTTYQLQKLDGDVATLSVNVTQTAPPQDVQAPDLPPGTKARLTKLDASGSGTMTLSLAHVMPVSLVIDHAFDTTMSLSTADGQPMSPGAPASMDVGTRMSSHMEMKTTDQ